MCSRRNLLVWIAIFFLQLFNSFWGTLRDCNHTRSIFKLHTFEYGMQLGWGMLNNTFSYVFLWHQGSSSSPHFHLFVIKARLSVIALCSALENKIRTCVRACWIAHLFVHSSGAKGVSILFFMSTWMCTFANCICTKSACKLWAGRCMWKRMSNIEYLSHWCQVVFIPMFLLWLAKRRAFQLMCDVRTINRSSQSFLVRAYTAILLLFFLIFCLIILKLAEENPSWDGEFAFSPLDQGSLFPVFDF